MTLTRTTGRFFSRKAVGEFLCVREDACYRVRRWGKATMPFWRSMTTSATFGSSCVSGMYAAPFCGEGYSRSLCVKRADISTLRIATAAKKVMRVKSAPLATLPARNRTQPTARLASDQITLVTGEERPRPGGLAKGVGEAVTADAFYEVRDDVGEKHSGEKAGDVVCRIVISLFPLENFFNVSRTRRIRLPRLRFRSISRVRVSEAGPFST